MDELQYLTERLDDQIKWYDAKSAQCQFRYKSIKIGIGLCSLLIAPAGLLWQNCPYTPWGISILGLLIASGTFILSLNQYHEKITPPPPHKSWRKYPAYKDTSRPLSP